MSAIPTTMIASNLAKEVKLACRWMSRNTRSIGSPFVDKGRLRAFYKIHSARRAGELLNLNSNQIQTMTGLLTGLLTGHCHLKGHLFKDGRVNSPV